MRVTLLWDAPLHTTAHHWCLLPPAQVQTMVGSAFTAAIECREMVRISFVVGGGKKVRQKYGDGQVLKDLTGALQVRLLPYHS